LIEHRVKREQPMRDIRPVPIGQFGTNRKERSADAINAQIEPYL
jgi:hypothetical protein